MGFLRASLFAFLGLTALYLLISVYARSLERERLEKEWDREAHPGVGAAARDAYIEAGMKAYHGSLRRKLIVLVYILPIGAVALIAYLVNTQ